MSADAFSIWLAGQLEQYRQIAREFDQIAKLAKHGIGTAQTNPAWHAARSANLVTIATLNRVQIKFEELTPEEAFRP